MTDTAHPVDVHVGQRLRNRRKEVGMSQPSLAEAMGVAAQQCQKYETGYNRISASRLWLAARALKAPITYFFDGL